ncbi:MAG: WD40 repeat domain-containing protein [Abitibacteriaceae bacterium]|nr:WD40 repeat domain-containing protein [Abditibacteriaceae bacterium]MBV9863909.1 WD40 repeat domain-containing protein [Abditibacteriaceae bacterium]
MIKVQNRIKGLAAAPWSAIMFYMAVLLCWGQCAQSAPLLEEEGAVVTQWVSLNNQLLVTAVKLDGGKFHVNVWDLPTTKRIQSINVELEEVKSVRLGPDNNFLSIAGSIGDTRHTLLSSVKTGQITKDMVISPNLKKYEKKGMAAMSPDGQNMAQVMLPSVMVVNNTTHATTTLDKAFNADEVRAVAWSQGSPVVAADVGAKTYVKFYGAQGEVRHMIEFPFSVEKIALGANDSVAYIAPGNPKLQINSFATGTSESKSFDVASPVTALTYAPDGILYYALGNQVEKLGAG